VVAARKLEPEDLGSEIGQSFTLGTCFSPPFRVASSVEEAPTTHGSARRACQDYEWFMPLQVLPEQRLVFGIEQIKAELNVPVDSSRELSLESDSPDAALASKKLYSVNKIGLASNAASAFLVSSIVANIASKASRRCFPRWQQ